MKTMDSPTGRVEPEIRLDDEVVVETESDMAAQHTSTTDRALPSHLVASQAAWNSSIVPKKDRPLSARETGSIARLQAEFLHVCLPLFFAEQNPVQTLGITSAVTGEGKTLAALLVSHALASSSRRPVVLVECDWQRPTLSRDLSLPASPGLSEWLRGTADRAEIRHQFMPNLWVVPAGLGGADAMTALAEIQRSTWREHLADPDELMILDLPSILGSYHGTLAARLAETLLLVVRAGSTPASFVTRACEELKHLHVEGIVLNQVQTRIPRWLQSLL